jgi:hypothetical protein
MEKIIELWKMIPKSIRLNIYRSVNHLTPFRRFIPYEGRVYIKKNAKKRAFDAERKASDVEFVSFPKSGRTWVRLMLAKYYTLHFGVNGLETKELINFNKVYKSHKSIPHIRFSHDDDPHLLSIDELERDKSGYDEKKIVFLTRNPKDVMVSLYFELTKRGRRRLNNISELLLGEEGGVDVYIEWHNIWAGYLQTRDDVIVISYENLINNTFYELEKLILFLGVNKYNKHHIREAISFANFKNMRNMEKAGAFDSLAMTPGNKSDLESYKTRKGKVGGYVNYLNVSEIEYLDKTVALKMANFFECLNL